MSRASAGGTATCRSPRLGCLTASSPARRPLLVGFWGLVAVMSGSGPMHRRCLTMLMDAVNRSRSAPSTEWRTTPTGRDVTALRFSGPICVCQPAQRRPSGPRLRLRCACVWARPSAAARLGNAAGPRRRPNVSTTRDALPASTQGVSHVVAGPTPRLARAAPHSSGGSDHAGHGVAPF